MSSISIPESTTVGAHNAVRIQSHRMWNPQAKCCFSDFPDDAHAGNDHYGRDAQGCTVYTEDVGCGYHCDRIKLENQFQRPDYGSTILRNSAIGYNPRYTVAAGLSPGALRSTAMDRVQNIRSAVGDMSGSGGPPSVKLFGYDVPNPQYVPPKGDVSGLLAALAQPATAQGGSPIMDVDSTLLKLSEIK